jgi:hypothetical protein
MWRIIALLFFSLVLRPVAAGDTSSTAYYVQLVRGTASDQPPSPGCRPVGPKLAEHFNHVFKWSHYWEICQRQVDVLPGGKARVVLTNGREVEIDLSVRDRRKVKAFQDGKPVDCAIGPIGEHMTLIGGDRDHKSVWFIVVRRDKPATLN